MYSIAYTPKGTPRGVRESGWMQNREYIDDIRTKREAVKQAAQLVRQGNHNVFVDYHNADGDLLNYWRIG